MAWCRQNGSHAPEANADRNRARLLKSLGPDARLFGEPINEVLDRLPAAENGRVSSNRSVIHMISNPIRHGSSKSFDGRSCSKEVTGVERGVIDRDSGPLERIGVLLGKRPSPRRLLAYGRRKTAKRFAHV